jgi:predicted amidohydrolase
VIAAAQAGRHNSKRESYGHSMIVDPWGEIISQVCGSEPGLAVAEIDLSRLDKVRSRIPMVARTF